MCTVLNTVFSEWEATEMIFSGEKMKAVDKVIMNKHLVEKLLQ